MEDNDKLLKEIGLEEEAMQGLPAVVNEEAVKKLYDVFEEVCNIARGTNFTVTKQIGRTSKFRGSVEIIGDEIYFDDTKMLGYIFRLITAADVTAFTNGKVSLEFTVNHLMTIVK